MCKTNDKENKIIRLFYAIMAINGVITSLINQELAFMGGLERAVGFAQFFIFVIMLVMNIRNLAKQSVGVLYGAMILQGLTLAVSIFNNIATSNLDLNSIQADIMGSVVVLWALFHRQLDLKKLLKEAEKIQENASR